MAIHVVMEPPASAGKNASESAVFIRDGFYFFGFIAPVLWMLWHRLWVLAAVTFAVTLALGAFGEWAGLIAAVPLLSLLISLYVGLDGGALRVAALRRAGWRQWGVIEADTIEQLIRAAEGRDHPDGLGIVPSEDDEYEIMPPESDPRERERGRPKRAGGTSSSSGSRSSGGGASQMTPARWALGAAGLLIPLIWLIISVAGIGGDDATAQGLTTTPAGTTTPGATPTPIAEISSGEDVTVFYPASLEVERQGSSPIVYRVVASAAELGGTWQPDMAEGSAAWLNGTYINHVFCLPPGSMELVKGMQRGDTIIMRPASGAIRPYEIVRARTVGRQQTEIMDQRRAGLTLIVCGEASTGNANERVIAEAVYKPEAAQAATLKRGDQALLPGLAKVKIATVRTLAPDENTPQGYAEAVIEVEIENVSGTPLRESDIADQLSIGGTIAERLGAQNTDIDAKASRRVTFRYLIPERGGSATWQATSTTGESVQIGLTIEAAPEGRPAAYTTTISQDRIRIRREGSTNMIIIPVTITSNRDGAEINNDFSLWVGARSMALTPQRQALPVTLDAGISLTMELAAQIPDVSQFEIQIGGQRWRVSLP